MSSLSRRGSAPKGCASPPHRGEGSQLRPPSAIMGAVPFVAASGRTQLEQPHAVGSHVGRQGCQAKGCDERARARSIHRHWGVCPSRARGRPTPPCACSEARRDPGNRPLIPIPSCIAPFDVRRGRAPLRAARRRCWSAVKSVRIRLASLKASSVGIKNGSIATTLPLLLVLTRTGQGRDAVRVLVLTRGLGRCSLPRKMYRRLRRASLPQRGAHRQDQAAVGIVKPVNAGVNTRSDTPGAVVSHPQRALGRGGELAPVAALPSDHARGRLGAQPAPRAPLPTCTR